MTPHYLMLVSALLFLVCSLMNAYEAGARRNGSGSVTLPLIALGLSVVMIFFNILWAIHSLGGFK